MNHSVSREIVICGLDGVLALIEHRLHHLHNEDGERDWYAFEKACTNDMPNLPLIRRLTQAQESGTGVIILSERSSAVRALTEQWLREWQVPYDALWLRPEKTRLPAHTYKMEVVKRHYSLGQIRRVYEFASQQKMAQWYLDCGTPCTLVGPNQGNSNSREQLELRNIRHACQHVVLYPFYGDDDHAWAERCSYLSDSICPYCAADEADNERKRQATVDRLAARDRGLPPLEGSDNQIAWAENIRLAAFGGVDKVNAWVKQANSDAQTEDPEYWGTITNSISRASEYLKEQTEARWWIDHRHGINNSLESGRALLNAVANEEGYF